jgi:hypothetical protein
MIHLQTLDDGRAVGANGAENTTGSERRVDRSEATDPPPGRLDREPGVERCDRSEDVAGLVDA